MRYLFLVEQKYEGKNREEHSCHRHFSNTKRTINAIVSLTRYNIRTMLVLTPFQSFQFFNTLGESSHDRSSIKANEELAWILTRNPDFYLLQRDNARAVKKSGDVPTRGRNFFPRDALRTIQLVVHHPVNPLHAVGAWLSIFQGFVEYRDTSGGKTSGRCCRVDRPRHRSEIEIDRPGRSSRSLAGLVRRQTAGLTVEPGLIEFRVRAERRFVIPASNLAASRATLFRQPRPSSSSGRLSRRVRAAGRLKFYRRNGAAWTLTWNRTETRLINFVGLRWLGMVNKRRGLDYYFSSKKKIF